MTPDSRIPALLHALYPSAIALLLAVFIAPVMAADAEIEAYMGDTVTISGVSYSGDEMYLFMTGDGLDPNGVTLTDTSALASEGDFTMVDVNPDQTWSYRWDTSKISREIDPGVFTIYASTEPVDVANLGGSGTYKTVEVWLKDSKTATPVSSGASYTLNPERHVSTQDRTLVFTPAPSQTPVATTGTRTAATTGPAAVNTTAESLLQPTVPATTTPQSGILVSDTLLTIFSVFTLSLLIFRTRH